MSLNKNDKIYVSGHTGMVGSAIIRKLKLRGFTNLIVQTRLELDLMDRTAVKHFFEYYRPQYIVMAAAKVGGIQANISNPVEFLLENMTIQNNLINQAFMSKVTKLLFLGSSCIYPASCKQPMKEEYLLTGEPEPTNEGYALAKITGLKLLEYYKRQYGFNSISLVPCNLYGTNDSFCPENAHVLSSLVKKFIEARESNLPQVSIWGTGLAMREFMHVDDMAEAACYFMENYNGSDFINVGWGEDISIKHLAELIKKEVGFKGEIYWDSSMPNGMPRKCMDVSRMKKAGFSPEISLLKGIKQTVLEYKKLNKIS